MLTVCPPPTARGGGKRFYFFCGFSYVFFMVFCGLFLLFWFLLCVFGCFVQKNYIISLLFFDLNIGLGFFL